MRRISLRKKSHISIQKLVYIKNNAYFCPKSKMKNPFKYGTIVKDDYFTDRVEELQVIHRNLESDNHLVLISPRRFGKSSLVFRAVKESGRPCLSLNLQNVISENDFASKILRELFHLFPFERVRHLMTHFRIVPTISTNPITNGIDVSFQPSVNSTVLLEDAMALLEKVSQSGRQRLIVVFDEFQEVMNIRKGLDKQLRSVMQEQQHLNYILLGSQESMMTEIFERKKSPFYHFGRLMHLDKIPYDDFMKYIIDRLPVETQLSENIAKKILSFTHQHPYYTQLLSSQVWELLVYEKVETDTVKQAIKQIVQEHDLDYERLWLNFNRTDRQVLQSLSKGVNPLRNRQVASSTSFSSIKRLMKVGYVIRTKEYDIEDPFFNEWIRTCAN